jgi:hypothetical protein
MIHTKWNSHNTAKYPQYKVTLMYMVLLTPRTSPWLTSLHFKTKSLHKSRQFTPYHFTPHHFIYLHSIPTPILLLGTTFLPLFLKVFSLQGKDASKLAGNWFQLLMGLFTKEYLLISEYKTLVYLWLLSLNATFVCKYWHILMMARGTRWKMEECFTFRNLCSFFGGGGTMKLSASYRWATSWTTLDYQLLHWYANWPPFIWVAEAKQVRNTNKTVN